MIKTTATQARQRWAETVDAARREPVTVTEHGRETVTIMDAELARRAVEALDDADDARAAADALSAIEEGEPTIPLEDIARELGIELG